MDRRQLVKNILLDDNNNIYLIDDRQILYLYDNDRDNYYPFTEIMTNIQSCNYFCDCYLVLYDDGKLKVFDDEMYEIYKSDVFRVDNIGQMCFCIDANAVVILASGRIYLIIVGDDLDDAYSICLNDYSMNDFYIDDDEEFESIRIVNNYLIGYWNQKGVIFKLDPDKKFTYVKTVPISKHIYDAVHSYDPNLQCFVFVDDHLMKTQCKNSNYRQHYLKIDNTNLFIKHKTLTCYYDPYEYKHATLVQKLSELFPVVVINETFTSTVFSLPYDFSISVSCTNGCRQIITTNNIFYLVDNYDINQIIFDQTKIIIDNISINNFHKSDTKLTIDIVTNGLIVPQLLNTIGSIYRLNNEMIFNFEQVDEEGTVVSYGDGVTSQVFYMLATELDAIIDNKFNGYNLADCFRLGQLVYFCQIDGNMKFGNIHPYFFYHNLARADHLTMLKFFKPSDYPTYESQYILYQTDPAKLAELDLGLTSVDDYIRYLLTADLTEDQIKSYDNLIRGYQYLAHRHKFSNFLSRLPFDSIIKNIIIVKDFTADIRFGTKNNTNNQRFTTFCKNFETLFNQLDLDAKSKFVQNVTGNPYYNGPVYCLLGTKIQDTIIKQTIYDENILGETDPVIDNDIIVPTDLEPNPQYEISTCETTITLNIDPTLAEIKEILDILIIEDYSLKN